MEVEIVNWDCSELHFHDAVKMDNPGPTKKDSIIIGQAVPFTIVFKLSNIGVEIAQNLNSTRSVKEFVDNLRHGFRVQSRIMAYNKPHLPAEFIYSGPFRKGRWMYCKITGSSKLGNTTAKQVTRNPCLKDGTHFHLPVDVYMPVTLGHCDEAEIVVMVSKPSNPGGQMDEDFGALFQPPLRFSPDSPHAQISASQDLPVSKTSQYHVNIIHPPDICFLHRNCAGKHLLFIQAKYTFTVELTEKIEILYSESEHRCSHLHNLCKKIVSIENCLVVPDASPKSLESSNCSGCNFKENHHSNLVKLVQQEVDSQSCFPCQLEHGEVLSLVFSLQTDGMVHNLAMQALHLVAHLTWRLVGVSYSDAVTTYKLPTVNMREIPFVVSPRMKSQLPVTAGESFQVIYSIINKLQDFDAVRLYWGPDFPMKGLSAKELLEVQNLKKFVICHDPDIQLGACPTGCTLQVQVGFQILQPGLYELGRYMKLNLRYNLPNEDGHSLPCLLTRQSPDDQLIASEELWRDRSGSTSSWTEDDVHGRNASERRQSFAAKSYSFGDLVHTVSTESDEAQRKTFRKVERSSTVLVWQRKNTSFGVTLTPSPNNFFKNSLQVYARDKEA